ncbi:hypothetical protein Btru_036970 [Bulinus truncatus]|nr:hypothetical protein Btru_036970 [Bulinus truncatus]
MEGDEFEECILNPGHINFYTVENCSTFLQLIPKCYKNDIDVERLIRLQVKLSVKISVSIGNKVREGTGFIYKLNSLGELNEGEIFIRTAYHVLTEHLPHKIKVFLLYDSDFQTNDDYSIIGSRTEHLNRGHDTVCLVCKMKKQYIFESLLRYLEEYNVLYKELRVRYESTHHKNVTVIISSHPHGAINHLTKGRYIYVQDTEDNQPQTYIFDTMMQKHALEAAEQIFCSLEDCRIIIQLCTSVMILIIKDFLAKQTTEDDNPHNDMKSLGNGFYLHHKLYDILYPHQKEGILWLWSLFQKRKGGILADDMGLGKTIQIIAFLAGMFDTQNAKCVMIVVPLSVMPNWLNEFNKWTPGINVQEYHGSSKKERERALAKVTSRGGVLLITYGLVITTKEILAERHGQEFVWDYIILDEGHKIKNTTKTSKSIHLVPARNRIILTGTPVQNNLKEMWSLFDYVHQGSLLGTLRTFKMEFETPIIRARERDSTAVEKKLGQEMSETLKKIIKPYFCAELKPKFNSLGKTHSRMIQNHYSWQSDVHDKEGDEDDDELLSGETAERDVEFIQHKIQKAQMLIAEESTVPSTYEERSKGMMKYPSGSAAAGGTYRPTNYFQPPQTSALFTQDDLAEEIQNISVSQDERVSKDKFKKEMLSPSKNQSSPSGASRRPLQPLTSDEVRKRSPLIANKPGKVLEEELVFSPDRNSDYCQTGKFWYLPENVSDETVWLSNSLSAKTGPCSPNLSPKKNILVEASPVSPLFESSSRAESSMISSTPSSDTSRAALEDLRSQSNASNKTGINKRRSVCLQQPAVVSSSDESEDDLNNSSAGNEENDGDNRQNVSGMNEEDDKENDPVMFRRAGKRNIIVSDSESEPGSCYEISDDDENKEDILGAENYGTSQSEVSMDECLEDQDVEDKEMEGEDEEEEEEELNPVFLQLV